MVRPKFPHMSPDEAEVLARWYEDHGGWDSVAEYDHRFVGPEPDWPPGATEADKAMWRVLNAKRPDVVFRSESARYVVEVTPRISKAALGGVVAYKAMLEDEEPGGPPVRGMIITGWGDPALERVAERMGVIVFTATPEAWKTAVRPPPFDKPPVPGR